MMVVCMSELYIDLRGRFIRHIRPFDPQVDTGVKISSTSKVSENRLFLT